MGLAKIPITWEGIEYPSIYNCACVTGINYQTLYVWIQKGFTSRADVETQRMKPQRKSSKLYLDYALQGRILRGK